MAKDKSRISHRELGPVAIPKTQTKGAALKASRTQELGDEFHHFGGLNSTREWLPVEILQNITSLMQATNASADPARGFLNDADDETAGVPAGYTYLFQLAAHDLVQTSLPAKPYSGAPEFPRNLRNAPLELETVMGGGPMACPFAFDTDKGAAKLRLGQVKDDRERPWHWTAPERDLPRTSFASDGSINRKRGLETVLVPDSRNDDNMVLAQLTALFHGIYNHLVDQTDADDSLPGYKVDEIAKLLLVRIYRRILRQDMLKRILHPRIYDLYLNGNLRLDRPADAGSTSVEFAFAAGRLGHAMVRNLYALNDAQRVSLKTVIKTSSRHNPKELPIKKIYLIDWDLFFKSPEAATPDRFNWALRFGPHVASELTQASAARPTVGDGVSHIRLPGTVFRDLVREASNALIGVDQLVDYILARPPDTGWSDILDPVIHGADRRQIVETGLQALESKVTLDTHVHLTQEQREAILADPPLSLFLMFEAQQLGRNGATLGPLGSLLVAEAMWPAFHPEEWEAEDHDLSARETAIFGSMPGSMPKLIAALKQTAPQIFAI